MAFSHGKVAQLYANGTKISAYLRAIQANATADLVDKSVFEQNDKTYHPGQQDATLSADGLFDGAPSTIDSILNGTFGGVSGSAIYLYLPAGDGAGNVCKGIAGSHTVYNVTTMARDMAAIHLEGHSSVGWDPGIVLLAHGARTASANEASIDNGALTSLGASAYLHVSAASGTGSPTLDAKVQHSVDNSVWADLITFSQVAAASAPTAQRGATAAGATVNRWLRVVHTIAGTTPSFSFIVGVSRRP